jgi:hypothetical protein
VIDQGSRASIPSRPRRARHSKGPTDVRFALVGGLALTAVAIGLVISGSPVTVAGTDSVPADSFLGYSKGGTIGCLLSGTIPRGTSAIRLSLAANIGPAVTVRVLTGSGVVTKGSRPAGWGIAKTVTVPVRRVAGATANVQTCVTLGHATEPVELLGGKVQGTSTNAPSGVYLLRIEYLRTANSSWWSLVPEVAQRMGFGHAASGTWVVFLVLALMLTAATLSLRLILREGARGSSNRTAAAPVGDTRGAASTPGSRSWRN